MSLFRRKPKAPPEDDAHTVAPATDEPATERAPAAAVPVGHVRSEDELSFRLREAEKTISVLQGELERTRAELAEVKRRSAGTDELAQAIGQPLAHLATQIALVQLGSSDLEATDLAMTGSGLLRALASAGITTDGEIGSTAAFDPNRHLALHGEPAPGDRVVLRSPATLAPSGQVVRPATVEPAT